MAIRVQTPLSREQARQLKSGDSVLLSGVIYTARDAAHKRLCELAAQGIETLYLVTDHTAFYERYSWHFLTTVNCDDGCQSRLYTAQTPPKSEPDRK